MSRHLIPIFSGRWVNECNTDIANKLSYFDYLARFTTSSAKSIRFMHLMQLISWLTGSTTLRLAGKAKHANKSATLTRLAPLPHKVHHPTCGFVGLVEADFINVCTLRSILASCLHCAIPAFTLAKTGSLENP
jgi:hypothetical protein